MVEFIADGDSSGAVPGSYLGWKPYAATTVSMEFPAG